MSRAHRKLNRRRWERVRRQVLDAAGWRCRACGRAGRLEVDHIVALEAQPDQDPFAISGLQALCVACHAEKTRRENARPQTPEQRAWAEHAKELLRA